MKLLIDIPEHIYEHAREMTEDSRDEGEAMRAIANGSQQRTGRWVKEGQGGRYKWMCSNCGTHHRALYDYCPSCGTRMEVEK
jgi:rubrerythrin